MMTALATLSAATASAFEQFSFSHALEAVGDHFLNALIFDGGRYLIAAGALTVLLLVFSGWAKARRIQTRSASRADIMREVLSSARTVFMFGVTTLSILVGEEFGAIEFRAEGVGAFTIALQFSLIVLLHDAYFYWIHRAMHTPALFRTTHLHHHKSRAPTPWTAYSFSAWEAAAEAAFVPLFLLTLSIFGYAFSVSALFFFLWHMIIRNVMAHAGHELFPAGWLDIPVLRWISTTTHHDLHHSSGHNYGFYFTFWDKWMGTEHPRYAEEFNANAKPIRLPSIGRRAAERIGGFAAALVAAGATMSSAVALLAPQSI